MWKPLSSLSYYNVSHRHQTNKQAVTGTTKDTTIISETPEIIRKCGNFTSHSVIMAVYRIGLWTDYGINT
jgi:hypothetical protein